MNGKSLLLFIVAIIQIILLVIQVIFAILDKGEIVYALCGAIWILTFLVFLISWLIK